MISFRGNSSIAVILFVLFSAFASVGIHKLDEMKTKLKKSTVEYEKITLALKESNNNVIKGTGL